MAISFELINKLNNKQYCIRLVLTILLKQDFLCKH